MSSSPSSSESNYKQELREAFNFFDKDKSGKISVSELKSVLSSLGIIDVEENAASMLKLMDIDGDGEISFEEFERTMDVQSKRKFTSDEVKKAFDFFDKDNSGFISMDELRQVLVKMGRHVNDDELARIFNSIDKDANGKISIDEFAQMLN